MKQVLLSSKIQSNITKIYAYKVLSEFWLIAPILIPFYQANGLNATQVFVIQAVYSLVILFLEIPSGFFADVMGRKRTMVIASSFVVLGLCLYAFSYDFFSFILAETVLALGGSLLSGTDAALLFESLKQMKEQSRYRVLTGRADSYARISSATASVLAGLLALIFLRLPFFLNIISGILLLLLSFTLVEPERKKIRTKNPFKDLMKIIQYSLSRVRIRSVMLFSSLITGTSIVGIWSYFLYYEKIGISIGYFGLLFALFHLACAYGARESHTLERFFTKKYFLISLTAIGLIFISLGLISSIIMIPYILLNGVLWGYSGPIFMNSLNRMITSRIRATVLSVSNMASRLMFVIWSPLFGRLTDAYSLRTAHIILGFFFVSLALFAVGLFKKHRIVR